MEQALGPVLVSASNAEVSVEASIHPIQGGFAALIVVSNAAGQRVGERTLEQRAKDCRELFAAGSLPIIAVAPAIVMRS